MVQRFHWSRELGFKNPDSFQRQMRDLGYKITPEQLRPVTPEELVSASYGQCAGCHGEEKCGGTVCPDTSQETPEYNLPPKDPYLGDWRDETGFKEIDVNVPVSVSTTGKHSRVAAISDLHFPYHDRMALTRVLSFLAEQQPEIVILNGDICDFYQISKFDKNPKRADSLQSDIDMARSFLAELRRLLPHASIYFNEGNHEFRMTRYLWADAPALSSLRCLKLESLLTLSDYTIALVPAEKGIMINGVYLVLHGDISSIHSGYTAKRMYEKHGGNGVGGHCHRLGSFLKRDRFGTHGWYEGGCLCQLNPDYIINPNWVQGLTMIDFFGNHFLTESIPIIGGKFIYGGKYYGE
jgi:predicted phosphodiesterase